MTLTINSDLERLFGCLPRHATAFPSTPIDALGFDSLDTVEFLCAVHEEFGVRLSVEDLPPGQTIAGLLDRITRRKEATETIPDFLT